MNTKKIVTTVVQSASEKWINIRKCSEPDDKVKRIYDALKYKHATFIQKKSVVPRPQMSINEVTENYKIIGG